MSTRLSERAKALRIDEFEAFLKKELEGINLTLKSQKTKIL